MNGNTRRACALGLVGLLAVVVLGACGGNGDASPKPTFSSSPSPTTASPSPTPTTSATADESPEAFVRRWNDLSTQMQNTGNTTDLRAASKGCRACLGTADLVDRYYAAGGYVKTRGWTIQSVSCKIPDPDRAECVGQIQNAVTRYKTSATGAQATLSGGPFAEYFKMQRTGSSWNMTYIAEQAQ